MAPFTIKGAQIRRDDAGRCHLGDLHAAAGGKCAHAPELWKLRDKRYAETVAAYDKLGFTEKHGAIAAVSDAGEFVDSSLAMDYAYFVGIPFYAATVSALVRTWREDGEAVRQALTDEIVDTALGQDKLGLSHSLWVH